MWNSTHRACAPLLELSRPVAKRLSAKASNRLACTGVSAEPMPLSPSDAASSADASWTSGNAAPSPEGYMTARYFHCLVVHPWYSRIWQYRNAGLKHGIRAETWLQILKTEEVLEKDCGCQEQKKRGEDLSNHQRLPDSTAPSIANGTPVRQTKHVPRLRSQDSAQRRATVRSVEAAMAMSAANTSAFPSTLTSARRGMEAGAQGTAVDIAQIASIHPRPLPVSASSRDSTMSCHTRRSFSVVNAVFTLAPGGMALWVRLHMSIDSDEWARRSVRRGVSWYTGRRHAFDGQ